MSTQSWTTLASSLGISSTDTPRSSPECQKLARKISKARKINESSMTELLLPVITGLTTAHPRLAPVLSATFNRDAIPLDHPSFIFNRTRLPTPRPAITLGYNPQIFHPHYLELMQGIISDPANGQPRNLDKISMACPGTYWPFFAIEINDDSFSPSHAAASAATATATCNNALLTLASVLNDISNPIVHDIAFRNMLTKSISSFSLAISTQIKSATLLAHSTSFDAYDGSALDAVSAIKTYNLSNPSDIESLSARLNSIFTWAETARLLSIMDILDKFDARVRFRETKLTQETEWGPMDMMQRGQVAPKLGVGMVQMSGGMGRGVSVPRVPQQMEIPKGKEKERLKEREREEKLKEKEKEKELEDERRKEKGKQKETTKREGKSISPQLPLFKGKGKEKATEKHKSPPLAATMSSGNRGRKIDPESHPISHAHATSKSALLPNGGTHSRSNSYNPSLSSQSHSQPPTQRQQQPHPQPRSYTPQQHQAHSESRDGSHSRLPPPQQTQPHPKYSPHTPGTPEPQQLKLTLNTAGAENGVVGAGGAKKKSLFKTVISDAMPAWTRVEL